MTAASQSAPTGTYPRLGWRSGFGLALGVLLPATTLGVELASHMCAETLFDPLPTPLHVVLVAAVPLGNLWLWNRLTRDAQPFPASWVAGVTVTVAAYYAAMFLPLTPLAVIAIVWGGLGLLPLSPLLCAIVGIGLGQLRRPMTRPPASRC